MLVAAEPYETVAFKIPNAEVEKRDAGDYHSHLKRLEDLASKPLAGKKFALVKETLGEGVDAGVVGKIVAAAEICAANGPHWPIHNLRRPS